MVVLSVFLSPCFFAVAKDLPQNPVDELHENIRSNDKSNNYSRNSLSKQSIGVSIRTTKGPIPLYDILPRLVSLANTYSNIKISGIDFGSNIDTTQSVNVFLTPEHTFDYAFNHVLRQIDLTYELNKDILTIKSVHDSDKNHFGDIGNQRSIAKDSPENSIPKENTNIQAKLLDAKATDFMIFVQNSELLSCDFLEIENKIAKCQERGISTKYPLSSIQKIKVTNNGKEFLFSKNEQIQNPDLANVINDLSIKKRNINEQNRRKLAQRKKQEEEDKINRQADEIVRTLCADDANQYGQNLLEGAQIYKKCIENAGLKPIDK